MLRKFISILVVAATLLLCGCELGTIDKLYHVPKRSEDDNKLQAAISGAMSEMEYCAPISGENQQIVQSVDLTGDGVKECLVFAKDSGSLPLHILVFALKQGAYVHIDTVDLAGSAFDKVEYAQIDGMGGAEIIVGTQVSEQLSGAVFMYSFSDGEARQLVNTDYRYWRTVDLDRNGMSELFEDYPMRLFCVNEQEDFDMFHTEIREVFAALKYRKDMTGMQKLMKENEAYRRLDRDSLRTLSVLLKRPDIWEERAKYMNKNGEQEEYDMCLAMREWEAEARTNGRNEGAARMLKLVTKLMECGEMDKIPMLADETFLKEMCDKYGLQE